VKAGDTSARILVVDDDPIILDILDVVLSNAGHAVARAASGTEALAAVRDGRPDLVVLDIGLPDMDGLEVCRQLRREHGSSLGILLLSANGRRSAVPGLAAGADDYVSKPFDTDELLARVESLLRVHAAEASARRLAERLVALQRITAVMLSQRDEQAVIDLVLTESQALLGASGVVLWHLDRERNVYRITKGYSRDGRMPPRERPVGEGIVGHVFEHREPVWINDYERWDAAPEHTRELGISAAVAAPLIVGDELLGVISARKVGVAAQFDEDDARLLGLLAAPAAVAIDNARLYAAQRSAAAGAAERAAQLEAVLDSMADGVLIVDAGGTVTSANRAMARLLMRDRDQLSGMALDAIFQPLRWPDGREIASDELPFAQVVDNRRRIDEREVVAEVGGNERAFTSITTPVYGSGAELIGAVSVLRDITGRRRAADMAAQADKLRALGQMASGVAHDVNNLLATVLGRAELARLELERGLLDAERVGEALRLIEQAAEDGAHTVRRIQEFARVRRDQPLAVVDVAEVVRGAVGLTRPQWRDASQAAGRAVDVALDLDADLFVEGEGAELREVLTNLLLNALDAMPRGGTISIAGRRDNGMVRLTVADTGVGMTPTIARRAFEPFFTTKAGGGTGLGLAIVYGIVQRRGGRISVASTPGDGTVFSLEFPAVDPPPAEPRRERRPSGPSRGVLIVDDEAPLVGMLPRLLASEGHRVTPCTSGEEALARFDPAVHDLVITDLGMADLNGLQLAEALRARSPETPVILATGWGNELDPDNPPPGVSKVLAKPYRLAMVLDAIDAVMVGTAAGDGEWEPMGQQEPKAAQGPEGARRQEDSERSGSPGRAP